MEISTLDLNITNAEGGSQLIPLTKCSNAFTCDHHFSTGSYAYKVQGIDIDGIDFIYDLDKSAVVSPSPTGTYTLQNTNSTKITIAFSNPFSMKFELRSSDRIGTTNFTLSVNAVGFVTALDHVLVKLQPMQVQIITLTGSVGSGVGGGTTSDITITASNGCVMLSATRQITVKALVFNSHYYSYSQNWLAPTTI